MAIRFDQGTDQLVTGGWGGTVATVLCWVRLESDRNDYSTAWVVTANAGGVGSTRALLATGVDGTSISLADSTFALQAGPNMSVGTWYAFGAVMDGANWSFFHGTSAGSLTKVGPNTRNAVSSPGSLVLSLAAEWLSGDIANLKVFTRALSDADVAAELAHYVVQNPTNLVRAHSFLTTALTPDSGAGASFTAGSTSVTLVPGPSDVVLPGVATDITTITGTATGQGSPTAVSSTTIGATATAFATKIDYDDSRGRVRLEVDDLPSAAVRAVVYAKTQNQSQYREVRGGRVSVENGAFSRPVDHYEYAMGGVTTYKIVTLSSSENVPDVIVGQSIVSYTDTRDQAWLKFIALPYLNRKITLADPGPITRESRAGIFNVIGQSEPVVVTDVHSSRRVSIKIITRTTVERNDLDLALSQGAPVFLHVPPESPVPSMYAVVTGYSFDRIDQKKEPAIFEVPLIEVSAPPPSVVGSTMTVQRLLDLHATVQDVLNSYNTVQGVLD